MIRESIKKKLVTTAVVAGLVVANTGNVFAAYATFSKALVEGNRYTYVTKYDGSSYVRCTVADDYGKTVLKGQDESFTLLKKYQAKGKTIKYYAKGNNPDLDCKISGSIYVDQES